MFAIQQHVLFERIHMLATEEHVFFAGKHVFVVREHVFPGGKQVFPNEIPVLVAVILGLPSDTLRFAGSSMKQIQIFITAYLTNLWFFIA